MVMQSPDAQACSLRFFGTQPVASNFTLADCNTLLASVGGPSDECGIPAGQTTIVAGYVRSRVTFLGNGDPPVVQGYDQFPPGSKDVGTLTSCLPLKIRVSSTQWQAPVWIDCDRRIEIPSPHACLDIVGPAGWQYDPTPDATVQGVTGTLVWEVWLSIKVCRADHYESGQPTLLTEQFRASETLPTDTVRPRAARGLSVTSSTATAFDLELYQGDPALAGVLVGIVRRAVGIPLDAGPLPSFTHLRAPAIVGAPQVTYAWSVKP